MTAKSAVGRGAESPTFSAVRSVLRRTPKRRLGGPELTPAGVMVLMYPKGGVYCVLLNKRSDSVREHKGEIAFPGGRKDKGDRTLLDTALRETHEEMGVRPDDVEVLGELDDVATNSHYRVSPYVGTIREEYPFRPDGREVAEVLEIPLRNLADESHVRQEVRIDDGVLARAVSYTYEGHLIFGATARILTRFLEILKLASDEEPAWQAR